MPPQLRRKAKVDDLSTPIPTPAPITEPEPLNSSSPQTTDPDPSTQPTTTAPHNAHLISTIPPTHTHFSLSPLLSPSTPSILLSMSPTNHSTWLSWHARASSPSPIISKDIADLANFEDVDAKFINYTEEGTLVLMSKVGYERFVRWRGRRGRSGGSGGT